MHASGSRVDGPPVFHPDTTHPGVRHAREMAHQRKQNELDRLAFVFEGGRSRPFEGGGMKDTRVDRAIIVGFFLCMTALLAAGTACIVQSAGTAIQIR